ncbi:DUF2167 domain-containing protein [Chitinophaga silvatica]|nr:DUF2167 domain-containing protein [Chitinophaga silvatica]
MCKLYYSFCAFLCFLVSGVQVFGLSREDSLSRYEKLDSSDLIVASFSYKVGEQPLGQVATLKIPDGYRLLDGQQSRVLVEQLWGNNENTNTIGVLIPDRTSPMDKDLTGIIISFEPTGYLSEEGAQRINYNRLMRNMKEEIQEDNALRNRRSIGTIKTIDWAFPPYFNKFNHSLHLAKIFKFESKGSSSLINYEIRLLGRNGALCFTAIGKSTDLQKLRNQLVSISYLAQFTPGNRYTDYLPGSDFTSNWGQESSFFAPVLFSKEKLMLGLKSTLILTLILLVMTKFVFIMHVFHQRKQSRKDIKINFDVRIDEQLN